MSVRPIFVRMNTLPASQSMGSQCVCVGSEVEGVILQDQESRIILYLGLLSTREVHCIEVRTWRQTCELSTYGL